MAIIGFELPAAANFKICRKKVLILRNSETDAKFASGGRGCCQSEDLNLSALETLKLKRVSTRYNQQF